MLSFRILNVIIKFMKKMIKTMKIAGLECQLYLPEAYEKCSKFYPVIYVNGEIPLEDILAETKKQGKSLDFLMLSIKPNSWNDDFTPWSAPAFRVEEAVPLGNADKYIKKLVEEIKPFIDENFRTRKEPENTILIGYSLGGLTALYAMYKTNLFGKIGSLSGSLWYDDWVAFMEKTIPEPKACKVYLSLGKKESKSRNARMAKVADCTEKATEIFKSHFGEESIYFEWNEGGHFTDIPKRFAKPVSWLIG